MTTVPTWAAYAVSIGTPVLTFLGVLAAQFIARRGAVELETRSNREETMRNLRWAAELSVSGDPAQAQLGFSELRALAESEMLDPAQQLFIDAALIAVVSDSVEEVVEASSADEPVEVVRISDQELDPPPVDDGDVDVPSDRYRGEEGATDGQEDRVRHANASGSGSVDLEAG